MFINCPVDVKAYDSQGKLVAQITNDSVQEIENGVVARIDENGQKIIILPSDEEYDIQLVATDDGNMTYTVMEYDIDSDAAQRVVSYYEVELSKGTQMHGMVENLYDTSNSTYPLILPNGETVEPTIEQQGSAVTSYTVDVSTSGGGTVSGGGYFVSGEFSKVVATADEGYNFCGWYSDNELVSIDTTYRFAVTDNTTLIAQFAETAHSYGKPKFSWTEDFCCSAAFICTECGNAQIMDCSVTSTTTPPTETEAGRTVYTATIEFNGQTYTDTVIIANSCEVKINVDSLGLNVSDEVWIDGVEYSVQSDGNGLYVELPDENARTMVTYSYNIPNATDVHTKYPIGMKVWTLAQENGTYSATYISELDNLLQYSGSSIRVTGNKGIRMITSINQDTRNKLTGNGLAGFNLLEYGTLLAQTSKLGDDPLVLGGANVKSNYAYKKGVADPVFKYTDGLIQYTNVLVGFTEENCKDDIAMRPYIKLKDSSGDVITIYGGIVQRSIGYIAWQNRDTFTKGSDGYNYIWEIINAVYQNGYPVD